MLWQCLFLNINPDTGQPLAMTTEGNVSHLRQPFFVFLVFTVDDLKKCFLDQAGNLAFLACPDGAVV